MLDGFGREISYARLSVTDLCNLRCKYCMPDGVEKKAHKDILSLEELSFISEALAELGVSKQRVTGGEPLVRKGVDFLLKAMGGNSGIKTLGLTTNGQLLEERASELYACGVNAVNVSLDTLNVSNFSLLTKGGELDRTLRGIDAALSCGFSSVKLNSVLLRGINDSEIESLVDYAGARRISIRFIELMPFAAQEGFAKKYFIGREEIIKRYGLEYNAQKSVCKKVSVYNFADGRELSFISPVSHKFCSECNRIRITADGKLLNCLHETKEYDVRPYLQDKEGLKSYIEACVKLKPFEHGLAEGRLQKRVMEDIGG